MELHHVRDFVAVAEELSFTRAADKLHVAQPSLTRKIRNLEEEIGVELLDRRKGHLKLTDAGRAFLADAKRLLALAAESIETARRISRNEAEQFRIGYTAGFDYHRLAVTLAAFQRVCPNARLSLFDLTCAEQMRALERGQIDIGFIGIPDALTGTGLRGECVASYELVVALPETSVLTKKTALSIKDLQDVPFIGVNVKAYPHYDEWMRRVCQPAVWRPRTVQAPDRLSVLLNSVSAGLGVALMVEQNRNLPHDGVVFRRLKPPLRAELCVAWRDDNVSHPLHEYLRIIRTFGRPDVGRARLVKG
ncbi:MAG TPA: LysR substrate-binding domain-containing protein [Candidatus Binataceae bacterium]